ncbi:hypothetical protein [Cognatishimia sp. MH4019]|uniref:hypothetical protein n=1 Tax=Cognatishimia sp. MH4019 TaxID=2854030 RepID=UPI001CD7132A|nr:hypothetical protein [Cognatishimia sp. MH4019]
MAHENTVMLSVNLDGETVCVDIFQRPDGSFGFDEFRRDPEDMRGWFSIGYHGDKRFETAEDALNSAKDTVGWLDADVSLPARPR